MKKSKLIILIFFLAMIFSCQREKNPITPPIGGHIHPQADIPWPSLADSPWPIAHGNVQCTGRSKYPGPAEGKIDWVFTTEEMARVSTSPVIGEDGTIYVPTERQLYAVKPNGTLKWEFKTGINTGSSVMVGAGDIIYLAIGSILKNPNYHGYFYALDSDGNLLWEYHTPGAILAYSAALGLGGEIYFVDLNGILYALNKDGTLNWKAIGTEGFMGDWWNSIAISPDGTTLFVAGHDSTMNAVDAHTGHMIWQIHTGYRLTTAPLVDNDGNIYFFAKEKQDYLIYSVKKDGEVRWKCQIEEAKSINIYADMHIDKEGNIYFCNGAYLCSLNYDGNLRWKAAYPEALDPVSPILGGSNGNIYIALNSDYVLAFNHNGEKVFKISIPWYTAGIINGALSKDGRLYVGASRYLVCIK